MYTSYLAQELFVRIDTNDADIWITIHMGYWPSLFGQDGWILAKFFFCVQKKNKANIQPSWPNRLGQ